jgi:hypothetical protein
VAIRFVLPEQESESVAFAYSPVVEAVLSLHVLVAPKHHPLQHAWVRRMRKLDPKLRGEIQAFRFAFVGHFPDFLFPRPDEEFLEFEQELAFLHDLDPETLAFEFLRPVYDHEGGWPRDSSLLERDDVREHVLRKCSRLGEESAARPLAELLRVAPPARELRPALPDVADLPAAQRARGGGAEAALGRVGRGPPRAR